MKKIIVLMGALLLLLAVSCTNNDSEFDQFKDAAAYILDMTYAEVPSENKGYFKDDMEDLKEDIAEAEDLEDAQNAFDNSLIEMLMYLYLDDENEAACAKIIRNTIKKYPKTKSYLQSQIENW